MRRVALSFLAHPDDAEILCAGTLIRLSQAGYEVHLATATPGDCGTMTETRWDIASIRTREARAAAAMLSAQYHCLDERDVYVTYDKATIKKAIDLFRRVKPTLVFTHPASDYMLDHEMVHKLARMASFAFAAPNASDTPAPAGAHVPHLYFCDPLGGADFLGNVVSPTTIIDISEQMDLKSKMLAAHASQREWLRAHHGMDQYIESMKQLGAARAKPMGTAYAEGFIQCRAHAYPPDDLLTQLLGKKAA